MGLDLDVNTLQSLLAGVTGGVPLAIVLVQSFKQIRDNIEALKEKLENFSTRLQRLELAFEVSHQQQIKYLSDNQSRIEARLQKLESEALKQGTKA